MNPVAALMLSGAIEEERRRGSRLRRRWLDGRHDFAGEELLGGHRPARDPRLPGPSASKR
jgi:hypothetical protein